MDFLVIDDDKVFREASILLIEDEGHYAQGAANADVGLALLREDKFDAVLLDLNLGRDNGLALIPELLKLRPNLPVVMFSAQGTVKSAVQALHLGAVDFLEKPFTRAQFHAVLARLQRFSQMGRQIEKLEQEVKDRQAQSPEPLFDFETPAMKAIKDVLGRAAQTSASVLILGESGTGKSVAARALHDQSLVKDKTFVTVSCPSLSKELLESQLFGHVRGSFTGAMKDHWGKVKAASGGTLFLDEIGDLPLEIQPKLLRLLQEREYERVGENVTRRADVRVVAATNRDLKKRVAEGAFREDLFYRLNVISVEMPPLRSRPEDVVRFAAHYLRHFADQCGRKVAGFTDEASECIRFYPWPGNLRELRNVIERAVILAQGDRVAASDLPAEIRAARDPSGANLNGSSFEAGALITLDKLEEIHIRRVLERAASLIQAAEILGIDQATLYRKRKKLGME
ncbi:MAG TPA: sigma-54 dependent transcriptional regulator [Opitutaceae bacterium]|jgi:NtrC-family two-component system response regulator AlgB|nr:sigma-54 dependent transcriptional regulator [Opitutaceae bacterium]